MTSAAPAMPPLTHGSITRMWNAKHPSSLHDEVVEPSAEKGWGGVSVEMERGANFATNPKHYPYHSQGSPLLRGAKRNPHSYTILAI